MKNFIHWVVFLLLLLSATNLTAQGQKPKDDVGFLPTEGDALAGSVQTELDTSIWDKIDLTSARMKPSRKPFPWWIPIVAVVGGTTTYFILRDDEDDPDPDPGVPPIANDVTINLICGEGGMVNPILNDIGNGLSLQSFAGPAGLVTRDGDLLIISPDAVQSFTISYTVVNDEDLTATGTVFVNINIESFVLDDQHFETTSSGSISTNLLENIDCINCILLNVDQNPAFAVMSWMPNGQFNFTVNPGFTGLISISYSVRDRCQQMATANIFINVQGEPCNIEGNVTTIPSDCGLNNGSIVYTPADPDANYSYFLNEEPVEASITNLPPNFYELRVQETDNQECFITTTVQIEELDFMPVSGVDISPGNCYRSGAAIVAFDNEAIANYTPGNSITFHLSGDGFEFDYIVPDFSAIDVVNIVEQQTGLHPVTGTIELRVTVIGAEERCFQVLTLVIQEEEVPFVLQDNNYQAQNGVQIMRNVLNNDTGTGIQVINFTPIDVTVFNIAANGALTFMSDVDGVYEADYTVRDTCDRELSAKVTITVSLTGACDLTATFTTTPADCGVENGTASVLVFNDGEPINSEDIVWNWSNGFQGEQNTTLPGGSFSVTTTINGTDCTETFTGMIAENNLEESLTVTPEAGNCLEEGDIILVTGSSFPYNIELNYQGELILTTSSMESSINLASLTTILPGEYQIIVTNTDAPDRCIAEINIIVPSEDLPLEVNDVSGSTTAGQPWNGNVLTNDSGTDLEVISFTQPANGTVTIAPNGDAIYTPPMDFEGTAQFSYTVSDACGQEATANVTIQVNIQPCDFTASVTTTPANCGTSNGSATLSISPPGNYTVNWDDGNTGLTNNNLPSGAFMAIINEVGTTCTMELSGNIEEIQNDYIQSISTTPSTCEGNGTAGVNITFPEPLAITLTLEYESAVILELETTTGLLQLEGFVTLFPGAYFITINGTGFPVSCQQSQEFFIVEDDLPFAAVDDQFTTDQGDPVSGNVMDNDMGTGISVVEFTQPQSGSVTIDNQGNITYTPSPEFSGFVTFTYTITDVCDREETATVTIEVIAPICDYTATFTTTPTNCGENNGTAEIFINPPGNYEINWSNGAIGNNNTNLPAGNFTATVTEIGTNCHLIFGDNIGQVPNEYILSFETSGSTCLGDGDISLVLSDDPGLSPPYDLTVILEGSIVLETIVSPGTVELADLILIFPGVYTIEINGQGNPLECLESIMVIVNEIEFPLEVVEDNANTPFNTPWVGNVLDNDTGEQLEVVSFGAVSGGTLMIASNGDATFTPNPGFTGQVVSQYTVEDICGTQATGTLTIIVEGSFCDDIVVTMNITPADCGLATGFVELTINPPVPPNQIMWSNGQLGPTLGPVLAGDYSVSITYPEFSCTAEMVIEVPENDPMHIENIEVLHESCNTPGDATMFLNTNGSGPLNVTLITPSGDMISFDQPPGQFTLSNIIVPTAGTYSIAVYDALAGPTCTHQEIFTIIEYIEPVISLVSVTPPSSPTSDDGEIVIEIFGSNPPFTVLSNGFVYGPFPAGFATISNLPEGEYTIVAVNQDDCASNSIFVPLFAMGFGDDEPYTSVNIYAHNSSQVIASNMLASTIKWAPGYNPYEQPIWPEYITLHQIRQIHGGMTFNNKGRLAVQISVGSTVGLMWANYSALPPLNGQWSSTYAGMGLQPGWKIGALKGSVQLSALGAFVKGHLNNENMSFDLKEWLMLLQIAPSIHIPVTGSMQIDAGFDIQVNPLNTSYLQAGSLVRLGIRKIF